MTTEPNIELPEATPIRPSHGQGLIKPFSKSDPVAVERARQAGRKGGLVAQQRRKEKGIKSKADIRDEARIRGAQLRAMRNLGIDTALRDTDPDKAPELVRKMSAHILVNILGRIAGGDESMQPRNLKEAVDAAKTIQTILRLEEGKPVPADERAQSDKPAASIADFARAARAKRQGATGATG